jgi:riboflavin synthase
MQGDSLMFSGIVESQTPISRLEEKDQALKLTIERPFIFNDISEGDSISVDGTCLTVETVTPELIGFTIGAETLRLTTWGFPGAGSTNRTVNLERSLKVGDRIHGHLVMGHADGTGKIQEIKKAGESLIIAIALPKFLTPYVWSKGSLAINGVSLTINEVRDDCVSVCLVPETLRRTNLSKLKAGDLVNIEVDSMARAIVHSRQFNSRDLNFE